MLDETYVRHREQIALHPELIRLPPSCPPAGPAGPAGSLDLNRSEAKRPKAGPAEGWGEGRASAVGEGRDGPTLPFLTGGDNALHARNVPWFSILDSPDHFFQITNLHTVRISFKQFPYYFKHCVTLGF